MKVVVFCGGLGVRMGDATQTIPKPLIRVGRRPILWHIMKWYASWGHTDFVLCLGWQAESIKQYFLEYSEALSNDFVLTNGDVELLASDTRGLADHLRRHGRPRDSGRSAQGVEPFLEGESMFLATYGDGLTDAPLDQMIETPRDQREDGAVRLRPSSRRIPPGEGRRGRDRSSVEPMAGGGPVDQRRLLRLPS